MLVIFLAFDDSDIIKLFGFDIIDQRYANIKAVCPIKH